MKFYSFAAVFVYNLLIYSYDIVITIATSNDVDILDVEDRYVGLKQTVLGKELDVYLGIPYAEPPVGDLRFRRPKPYEYKGGVIKANEYQNTCTQPYISEISSDGLFKSLNPNQSEDCLHLNVWAPKKNKNALKPVMLMIHGGSLLTASASLYIWTGEAVAAMGDVVVVSFNYRLQALGFLYAGTDDAPGNVGLWDQVLAMQWVRDNIQHFGGDPNQVTLFGVSAGSWSVSLHILSPVSRGLFKNAIMMSGSALTHMMGERPERALKTWLKIANETKCGNGLKFTSEDIECLRRLPAKELIEIANKTEYANDLIDILSTVRVGDEFMPKRPNEMLANKDFKKNFNLLVSVTDDEGTIFLRGKENYWPMNPTGPLNLTKSEAIEVMKDFSSQIQSDVPINGEEVVKLYLSQLSPNDTDGLRRNIGVAIGDFYLGCPTTLFGKAIYSGDENNTRVYQYYYTYKIPGDQEDWQGAVHGADAVPVWGSPLRNPEIFTPDQRDLSRRMITAFTHFAKHGSLPPQEGIEWMSYYTVNGNVVQPYYEWTNKPKPLGNFGFGHKEVECEKLWKYYIEKQ